MTPPVLPTLRVLQGVTLTDGVLRIELDHGRANEMGSAALDDWQELAVFLESGGASAVITTSRRESRKGTPLFIAGADVTERVGWSDAQVKTHVRRQRRVLERLRRVPALHIAVVDGVALGWGTEFLLCCDYRIAGPRASFALPETGLGILPGAGGTSELWTMVGVAQALRLGMTGERIDTEEAVRIGLVQEAAPSLLAGLERADALAARVLRNSPTAVAAFKRAVLDAVGQPAVARSEQEARAYEHCVDTGQAAIGRASFKAIRGGERPEWGPLQ